MNNVTLIGNLCRDFELRQTIQGTSIASNTIAVRRDRKEADGSYASDFFDVYCFGSQADYAVKYLRKGDKASVAGSVHIRDYTTRNGTKGRAVEVIVTSIENLMPKDETVTGDMNPTSDSITAPASEVEESAHQSKNLDQIEVTDDDLPF